jgi:fibronectin-binding autotransporter adhesin
MKLAQFLLGVTILPRIPSNAIIGKLLAEVVMKLERKVTLRILGALMCCGFFAARLSATVLQLGDVEPDVSSWNYYSSQNVGIVNFGSVLIDGGSHLSSGYLGLGFNVGSSGSITVTGEGSALGAPGWLSVGVYGTGSLIIADGASVGSDSSSLASGPASVGSAIVTGTGSAWVSEGSFSIGRYGQATLTVEDGGKIDSENSYLGVYSGSSGMVSVTGTASRWTSSGNIYVGYEGDGKLTVADGGQIYSSQLFASLEDLSGNGLISVSKGAVLDTDLKFDASHGLQQQFEFGDGGILAVNWSGGGLGVGYKKVGTLTVADGVEVNSSGGILGKYAGSAGVAVVTGTNSKWNTGGLSIGEWGHGSLTIEAGGLVSSATVQMGYRFDSTGSAIVKGVGSRWLNQDLYVGSSGTATLEVLDGGQVSTSNIYASLSDLLGNGTINSSRGAVLDADFAFTSASGTSKSFPFGNGGTLNVQWTGGALGVGYKGNGRFLIQGVSITSSLGVLGRNQGSSGDALISGRGSKWTVSSPKIGDLGKGVLTIESGGMLNSSGGYLGYGINSSGTVVVNGRDTRWISTGELYVGHYGQGYLTIEAGGQVYNSNGLIAYWGQFVPNVIGSVTVDGPGSLWNNNGHLLVAGLGTGILKVENGGRVTNTYGSVGVSDGSIGTVTITGKDSSWANTNSLTIGTEGIATLNITSGATVTTGGILTIDQDLDNDSFINMATGAVLALKGEADDSLAQFLALVNGTDAIRYWNHALLQWSPLTSATLGVDYTLNYSIFGDFGDYTLLTVGKVGDADGDGDVDGRDFLVLQRNPGLGSISDWQNAYGGNSELTASTSVPEPNAVTLAISLAALSSFSWRRNFAR